MIFMIFIYKRVSQSVLSIQIFKVDVDGINEFASVSVVKGLFSMA